MVPFLDLKAQLQTIRPEIDEAIKRVLDNTQFALGEEVKLFEEEFSTYCGAEYGVGVNSGTSALHLALLAAGIGPGDEVITVPFTFVATVAAVVYTGARPVFVDVEPRYLAMDPARIEEAITERTKAILPVHIHGHPADLDPILEIARKHGLLVIEDAAQAHGAEYRGRRAGGIGDLGCFSFYPGKNLGACGEGGIVVTDNPEYVRTIRMLRDWGQEKKYHHVLKGYNYRLEGIQGAVLRVKLRHLESWTEARRANAALYNRLLKDSSVTTPLEREGCRHVYHIYAVRTPERERLMNVLKERGIAAGIHYPFPVHLLEAYRDLGYQEGDFPVSEEIAARTLSLPMYAELTEDQIITVTEAINEASNG